MLPALQINNAGDGGLYAEMVRDRSFEALAAQPLPTEAGMKVYPYLPGSLFSLCLRGHAMRDSVRQMGALMQHCLQRCTGSQMALVCRMGVLAGCHGQALRWQSLQSIPSA